MGQSQGMMQLCCGCLAGAAQGGGGVQSGGYAYQSFNRIPFFGSIAQYLRMKDGRGGASFFDSIGGFIGNVLPGGRGGSSSFNLIPGMGPSGGQGGPGGQGGGGVFDMMQFVNFLPFKQADASNPNNFFDLADDKRYVKKIKKSIYSQVVAKHQGTTNMFTDDEFPPTAQSIGKIDGYDSNRIQWKRIGEIMSNPIFIKDKVQPGDILQGQLGNCYFLSALASLAEQQHRIKNIFPNVKVNPNGIYMARVLHDGIYQQVVVDDYFPIDDKGKPLFARPSQGNQIWVMVVQKCWAKLFGSYAATVGGLPHQVLHAFSGAPTFYRSISTSPQKRNQLWNQMVRTFQEGALLCCGTKADEAIQNQGFVLGHAYTILGVYHTPHQLIKLRNPWGNRQWRGRASDFDTNFWNQLSPQDKQKLDYEDNKRNKNTDGVFFILWQDFLTYFALVDICKINDNSNYNFIDTTLQTNNPKLYDIQVKSGGERSDKLTLALSQASTRGMGQRAEQRGYARSFMALGRYDEDTKQYTYVNSNTGRLFSDNYLQVPDLKPGKYILYGLYLWNNGQQSNPAVVSAYSPSAIVITQSKQNVQPVLQQIFYDHARKNPKKKQLNGPQDWLCSDFLLSQGAFGYAVINLGQGSKDRLSFQVNQNEYTQRRIELMRPYKGRGRIVEQVSAGKPLVVVMHMPVEQLPQEVRLPQPKINQLPS